MNRILVIRGGAIGDFILTLPAVKALRDAHPHAHLEILGYKHIAALAENRFYAQAVRSIESATLSSFFAKDAKMPSELSDYFASFDLIVSYLYDPDQIFENNLRRCGVKQFLRGPGKIDNRTHAARQLAEPLSEIGIEVADLAAKIYPSVQDRHLAQEFLEGCPRPIVAFHPGSGSETKNWPLQNWIDLGNQLIASETFRGSVLVIAGEADEKQASQLESLWRNERVRFAKHLPLPLLGALLEKTIFIGHDSGISHLAAAVGANCILLFGPTDPAVWAPLNQRVSAIHGANNKIDNISCDDFDETLQLVLAQ